MPEGKDQSDIATLYDCSVKFLSSAIMRNRSIQQLCLDNSTFWQEAVLERQGTFEA